MAKEKIGIVLSGGGAKGAGQLGMMKYLYEQGIRPEFIAGISVGSLNATMWAQEQNLELLEKLWRSIRGNSDIYRVNWLKFWKLYRSLYDNTPLWRLIQKYVDPEKLKGSPIDLKIGVVQLQSGAYLSIDKAHPDYRRMLLASTAIPVVFKAVNYEQRQYVDGGTRNVAPLKLAIDAGCTTIYLLHCFPLEMNEEQQDFNDSIRVGIRSFMIMYNEALREDILTLQKINEAVKARRADPQKKYRVINLITITPSVTRQFVDVLNFSPKALAKDIELGYEIAREILGPTQHSATS
ncbi:MAG: patatin-like phospholipase family protein [candidate division KSB1 bacterium]|nr:patatin-like phospholipase family protein [candidate division KSB1 bacterium]